MGRRRRTVLVPAVLALAVLAGACGGGSGDEATGVATAGDGGARNTSAKDANDKVDPQQAGLDFARCMREHGIDMPDPQGGEGGLVMIGPATGAAGPELGAGPPPGFEEADKACRHHLDGLIQEGGGPIDPKEQDRALAFARCMREHGVDMPDPDFSLGGGVRIQIGDGGIDPGSSTFQEAQKACGSLFGPATDRAPAPAGRARS